MDRNKIGMDRNEAEWTTMDRENTGIDVNEPE